jgi:hypothetical protein
LAGGGCEGERLTCPSVCAPEREPIVSAPEKLEDSFAYAKRRWLPFSDGGLRVSVIEPPFLEIGDTVGEGAASSEIRAKV